MKFRTEISAGGIVFKKDNGQVLWLTTQHSQHKGWGFPKGLIGDNVRDETKEVAALREVQEEGGVKAKIVVDAPIETHYMYRFQGYLVKKTVYYFLMEYESGNINDHDWEVSDIKFATEEEIKKTLTFKNDQEAFDKILHLFNHLS